MTARLTIGTRAETDEALAVRAAARDNAAFEELTRRYQPLLCAQARRVPEGQDRDDAHQEALIGLFEACRSTDGKRSFAGMAKVNVRWRLSVAGRDAATLKQRLLSDALRPDGSPRSERLELPAPESADPARIVELREELRERLRERPDALSLVLSERHAGRRYSPAQIATALAVIADGATVTQAAKTVGASYGTVREWVEQSPADAPARRALEERCSNAPAGNLSRRFSDEQKQLAVRLVTEHGRPLREAAAAVGATNPTILRWIRQAA
jgi:RNA polymerase sigma factor (sigma-70 family)